MLEEWYFTLLEMKRQGLQKGIRKGRALPPNCSVEALRAHFKEEIQEVKEAWDKLFSSNPAPFDGAHFLRELADLSNMIDLTFETYYYMIHNYDKISV